MPSARAKHAAPPWSQIWQMPTLVGGMFLLGLGIYLALPSPESNDFDGALDDVEKLLEANEFEQALAGLKYIAANSADAEPHHLARHQALMGDQVYLEQYAKGDDERANHKKVVAYYTRAEQMDHELSPAQVQRWSDALISLGQEDEALAMVARLGHGELARQLNMIRKLVDSRLLERGVKDPERVASLLVKYDELLRTATEPALRREGSIWLGETEARLRLDQNQPVQAINALLIRYQRLVERGGDDDLAPLMIQFGNAYLRTGDFGDAERYFLRTLQVLDRASAGNAEVLIGLAQVEQLARNDDSKALAYYQQAVRDYPATPAYLRALIGQADVEAKIDAHGEAIDHFAQAIKLIIDRRMTDDPRRDEATNIIQAHYELNFDRGEYNRALDYLSLIKPLYPGIEAMPAELLYRLAVTHERFAEQRRADATAAEQSAGSGDAPPAVSASVRRLANIEAAENFTSAARYYLVHADKVSHNDEQHGQSLWRGAQCYDAAQRWDKSIRVYLDFLEQRRADDPLYLKAARRRGLAYLADRQYQAARLRFAQLIDEHPRSPEAILSLVPLAKCHDRLGEMDNAVRVLQHVVTDHPTITPQSSEYRDALIELGRIHYKQQQFEPAITRLTEAVERYGASERGAELRFLLADSHRQSAQQIAGQLNESLPDAQQVALRMARVERLETALNLYGEVIDALRDRPAAQLSDIEKLYQRNAYFYRGDCAFDLGRYDEAIGLYDKAARQWERDPASLIALVQIVNAYCEQGKIQEARVANDRARWQFKNIPDSAFEDPNLPMNRKHWKDWLRWSDELNLFDTQANVGKQPAG